jgi:6-phosphogluconolactonase
MKFNTILRNGLATALSLGVGLGFVACSRDYTADYVYAISAQGSAATGAAISAYAVDFQTGILTQISGSPFSTQLSNPTTVVATPNGKFIFVIGGSQNSEVESFGVGTDGKLYGVHTYNLAANGTYPTAASVDTTGTFLYVTYTYQNGFGTQSVGPGGVSIFAINSDGSLGTPTNVNVGNNPVGVAVSAPVASGTFVYVVDQEGSTYSPGAQPTVLGFQQNTTTGALTLLSGTTYNTTLRTYQGTKAGVTPSAIAVDPTGRFVYVTDQTSNEVFGYQIGTATGGNLTAIVSSPFATGLFPVAITVDPRAKYVYTANFNSNTVSAFSLNSADGSLGGAASTGNFTTSTGPTCVTIDPALGIYLYTSNRLDGSISGAQLSANTGVLNSIENTPFPTSTLPSCVVAVANGSHASQLNNP